MKHQSVADNREFRKEFETCKFPEYASIPVGSSTFESHWRGTLTEDLGVSLIQVMQLTAECLNGNLRGGDTPIAILWKKPKGQKALRNGLPKEIKK
jgi:hypothetical protein